MPHEHSVNDSDAYFIVDSVKRTIKSKSKKATVMQYDHNSERFTFEVDRYIDGHDMSTCTSVEVHYKNGANCGVYIVDDLEVSTEDADKVLCSWLVSSNATQNVAPLEFRLTFKCVSGKVLYYEWSTAVFRGITVAPGIRNSEAEEKQYADAISYLTTKVRDLEIEVYLNGGSGGGGSGQGSSARVANIKLSANKWVGATSPYSQVVAIDGITEYSQVDLTPSPEQLVIFHDKDLAFVAVNEDGEVTVYAIGQKPENDYTMQVTITEVFV